MARKKLGGGSQNGPRIDEFLVAGQDYLKEGAVVAGFYMGGASWMDGSQKRETFIIRALPQDGCTLNKGISYGIFGGGQMRYLLGQLSEETEGIEHPYVVAVYLGKKPGDKDRSKQLFHTWSIVYDDEILYEDYFGKGPKHSTAKPDATDCIGYQAKDMEQASTHFEQKDEEVEDDEFI